jgi:hypothetical protein
MNKKSLSFLLLAVLLTTVYFACRKPDPLPKPVGAESRYFPLQIGKWIVYQVDSTIWDDTNCVTIERHRQIRYNIADTFTDAQGRLSYRIETWIRKNSGETWDPHQVYYVTNTGTAVEMMYEELRFVKLQFPVVEGATWAGNAFVSIPDSSQNYFKDWEYRYFAVNKSFNAGTVVYDSTITVTQRDETINEPETIPQQFGSRTYSREVFAAGIGMVYREYYHWTYDPTAPHNNDPNNDRRCLTGDGVVMRAIDHN